MLCGVFVRSNLQNTNMKTRSKDNLKVKRPAKLPLAIKHQEYLTLLSKSKNPHRRKKLIEAGNSGEIQAVTECIQNIISGNVPVNKNQLKLLKRYKYVLRNLAKKCRPIKNKKKMLLQKGGFLGALLPIALNALGLGLR